MITEPAVVFADEPTGALDTSTARDVLGLLRHSAQTTGQTIVMVTHDPVAAAYADGLLVGELLAPTADAVAERMTRLGAFVDDTSLQRSAISGEGSR